MWSLSDSNGIWTRNHLVRKRTLNHLTKLAKWLGHVVSTYLCDAVCYYRVTYVFQSESTLHSCLNAKELLGRSKCNIQVLSDSNGIRTLNPLLRKITLNHSTHPAQSFGQFGRMVECSLTNWVVVGSNPVSVT